MKQSQFISLIGLFLSALLFFSFSNSWGWDCVEGKGPVTEKTISLEEFSSFSVGSSADVILKKGKQSVVVIGQENIIDLLKTEVKNNEWKIDFKENVCLSKEFKIEITIPELDAVTIDGSGDVLSKSRFSASDVSISINGSGNVDLEFDAEHLETNINGSGDVDIKGSSNSHEINIAGSGDVDCADMETNSTDIKIMGSGDCKVHAKKDLKVKVMGSGDVLYKGDPELDSKIMGSGDVKRL